MSCTHAGVLVFSEPGVACSFIHSSLLHLTQILACPATQKIRNWIVNKKIDMDKWYLYELILDVFLYVVYVFGILILIRWTHLYE